MIDTKALRQKILDLAIQGKLLNNEEDYKMCETEGGDKEFIIPCSWKWVKLSEITNTQTLNDGDWVVSSNMVKEGPVKLIQLGSIGDLQYKNKGFKYLTESKFKELNGKQIYPGYMLINRIIAGKMMICLIPEIEGILITAVDACWVAPDPEIYNIKYLMYALSTSYFQSKVKDLGYGVTRFRISKINLINIEFPFPPLPIQDEIVEKIDSLFSYLSVIDTLQNQYEDNLSALKGKLIDAAIQGKLTEQLPEDGTAEELYQQIQQEKRKLVAEGKIKKEKALSPVSEDEIPFDIPDNWKWVRLNDLTVKITSGNTPPGGKKSNVYVEDGYCFFREQNIYNDGIYQDGMVYISEELLATRGNSTVYAKDILLNITGGSIGRCAIVPDDFDKGSINQHILIIRLVDKSMRFFIHKLLCSSYGQNYIKSKSVGDKDGFSGGRCKNMPIPLPPLAEQKRIVSKLEEILPLCE